jgi:putative phosphoesterase
VSKRSTTSEREAISLHDGRLRFVAVADTHSAPHPRSHELIAREKPDHILHCGDIGDLRVLDALREIAPTHAVRGNIDAQVKGVPDVRTIDIFSGDATALTLLLLHIAVYGPKLRADAARLARDAGASIVVCGHSHVPFLTRDRDLVVFNPGSIGPRRFHLPIVFGVIDIDRAGVDIRHISCETGKVWRPGLPPGGGPAPPFTRKRASRGRA